MVKKSVLVIGLGGREHALGWKLKQSKHVGKIYFAPGNAGTSQIGENVAIEVTDVGKLVSFAQKKHIDLTVVGPELSLAVGVVDAFEKEKLVIFGPSKKAAELETDKAFAADFVEKHKIPHPKSFVFTNVSKAKTFFKTNNPSDFVIKAAGLALGKGVVLPATFAEAEKALEDIMVNMQFGDAGKTIVVQERITGPEVSLLALSDGKTIVPMLPARDYKRVYDNGDGPNTGGMGAYAPAPFVDEQLLEKLHQKILIPTINGMKKNGRTYKGVLYVGLMLTRKGPMVIEYNNRFGDPETQPLMLLLDEDLFEVLSDCAHGTLSTKFLRFKNGAAVSVVLTSNGYPGKYKKGEIISGLEHVYNSNIVTFHAGTAEKNNKIISNGGRVLNITAFAKTQEQAAKLAYSVIGSQRIHFANMHYRHDIAYEKKYTINTKRYKAALFDFDGTLVDTEPLQYKSFALTLKEFGHTIVSKKEYYTNFIGKPAQVNMTKMAKQKKLDTDVSTLLDIKKGHYDKLATIVLPIAGCVPLLLQLKKRKVKLAIVSSSNKKVILEIMKKAGIPDIFDTIVSVDDITKPKPNPQGYLLAAKRLEVTPKECLVFEDALTGIEAAKKAGMQRFLLSKYFPESEVHQKDSIAKLFTSFANIRVV